MLRSATQWLDVTHKTISHCEHLLRPLRRGRDSVEVIRSCIERLDAVSNNLCSIVDVSEASLRLPFNDNRKRGALQARKIGLEYMCELNADRTLYKALVECLELHSESPFLDEEGLRVGRSLKQNFERAGLGLSGEQLSRLRKSQREVLVLEPKIRAAPQFNLELIYELTRARSAIARLLGAKSYAELILHDTYFKSTGEIHLFLSKLESSDSTTVAKSPDLRQKSTYDHLEDLRELCAKLFSLKFTLREGQFLGLSGLVLKFTCFERDYGQIIIAGAPSNPCHYTIRTWRLRPSDNVPFKISGACQTPISLLTLPWRHSWDAILSHEQARTLYHEFGHAMHAIMGKTGYHHLSGTRCPIDYAEVPSSLFELLFIGHGGNQISSLDGVANETEHKQQILLAKFDLFLHGEKSLQWSDFGKFQRDLRAFEDQWDAQRHLQRLQTCTHLLHYGGSYYTYLLGQRIATAAYSKYFGPFALSDSKQLVEHGLATGGTKSTREIVTLLELDEEHIVPS